MTSPQKAKGDRAELALVKHLLANGFAHARRTKAGGEKDLGDLSGVVDRMGELWCVQVADRRWRSHGEIEAKAREAEAQAVILGAPWWLLVAKRPGCSDPGDWWCWLPTWMLLDAAATRNDGTRIDPEPTDLCCVTVRAWLALVAPEPSEAMP